MKKTTKVGIKTGSKVQIPVKFVGYTDDGLAIVSLGTIDNYVLTLTSVKFKFNKLITTFYETA